MAPTRLRSALLAAVLALAPLAAAAQPDFAPAAGTEGRAWLAEPPTAANPAIRFSVTRQDAIRVPTRDGTVLDGRLFTPVLAEGAPPTPCVLMADGYGRASRTGTAMEAPLSDIAARGYAVLHLSLRGAEGGNDLYGHYGEDGYDAVEWMAQQPWCNGRVGMVGASLLGISQWLTAKEGPPSLKAIVPEVACADCYGQLWYPGGMLPGPGRQARRLVPGATSEYAAAIAHRDDDAWWRARSVLAGDTAAIAARGVAAFIAGGLDDYISPANVRAYEQFDAPGAHKRLFLGPYGHGWHTAVIQELQIQWLDHWLKGVANGADTAPRVIIYVKGANRWRAEPDWPLADAHATRLHLSALRSDTIASRNDGALTAQAFRLGEPAVLPYSPDTGPFLPAMLSTRGRVGIDQAPDEAQVLTWTSAKMTVATEVTGYPKLSFWAAASAADADVVAQLTDVAPDGTSQQVVQAYLNLPRAGGAAPQPLVPGQARRFELETYPVAYVFQPGHRIRLSLAGGAKPAPGQAFPQGPGKNPAAFELTVLQDGDHPATLDLPVVGTGWQALSRAGLVAAR